MSLQFETYPVPDNESQRHAALNTFAILDSAPEMDFDALTRVAAHALHVPIAVVGLLDADRLWIKSHFGLDVPQLDRRIAFCAHAVMKPDEILVVENLMEDARFKGYPLVADAPRLRFYAGAPLVDANKNVIGTLAIVDTIPRKFDEEHRRILKDLALLVMVVLDHHRLAAALASRARTDYLTNLLNRGAFESALHAQIAHAGRSGEIFSVLYMDLDGFKQANDRFGHARGDAVLREVARRLDHVKRDEDILARLGGDEFGMLVRGDMQSARKLADRIEKSMQTAISISCDRQACIGISVGIGEYVAGESQDALLARADQDLYQNKRAHRPATLPCDTGEFI